MQITIYGQCPAQKNSKNVGRNPHTGRTFVTSNKIVKEWQHEAVLQLASVKDSFEGRVQIDYYFYCKDNRRRDTDNMIASINDALQAAGIIEGDHWQVLRIGSGDAEVDKDFPRSVITITQI